MSSEFGITSVFGPDGGGGTLVLLLVAASVAWARVALGKHSVLDVVVGSMLGILFVDVFETVVGASGRWLYVVNYCLVVVTCVVVNRASVAFLHSIEMVA